MNWQQLDKDASMQHEIHNPQWLEGGLRMVYGKREDDWGESVQQVYPQCQPSRNMGQVEYVNWTAPPAVADHLAQAAEKGLYQSKGGNWVEANHPTEGESSGAPRYYEMPAQHMMRTSRQTPAWSPHTMKLNSPYGSNMQQETWYPDNSEILGIGAVTGEHWSGMGHRLGMEQMESAQPRWKESM